MSAFFRGFKSLFDVLSVGRLLVYPFAGIGPVVAMVLLARLASAEPERSLRTRLASDFEAATREPGWLWLWALVVGFLVVVLGFATVVRDVARDIDVGDWKPGYYSWSLRYPLTKKDEESYESWMMSEYYRFVELSIYVPLGGLLGLSLTPIYVLVHALQVASEWGAPGFGAAHVAVVATTGCVIIAWMLWRMYWLPRVVIPVYATYERAKRAMLIGIRSSNPDAWYEPKEDA